MTIGNEPDHDDEHTVTVDIAPPSSPKSPKSRSLETSFAADAEISKKKRMHLQWEQLSFSVQVEGEKKPKQILHKISSELRPGELTAIMGPSGSGKSTLLNALAGRAPYGTAEGKISLNGKATDPSMYRNRLAYVMQHDALFAMQTPNEVLYFTASLRYPKMSEDDRRALVASAIEQLGLERCQDTLIGSDLSPGLSGGEKKRTAVAVELISNPSLIFLDEPTSGLDSYSAFELVKILKRLAANGRSVICTIHQPSSEVFEMFSRVILLRKGVLAYDGKVSNLTQHFAESGYECEQNHFNPADFVMMKMQTLTDEEMAPLIKAVTPRKVKSSIGGSTKAVVVKEAPYLTQVRHLFTRELHNFSRDVATLRARLGMALSLATIVGLIFFQNGKNWGDDGDIEDIFTSLNDHRAAIVFMGINALFLASQPMLIAFPTERPVFIREHISGTYSAAAYMTAKTMIDVPAGMIQACISVGICYGLMGLNAFVLYLIGAISLLCAVSSSCAILLGSAVTRAETAVSLSPATVMPQLLFSGILIAAENIPIWIRWMQWTAPLKYAVNLGFIAEFHDSAVPDDRQFDVANLLSKNEIGRDSWWWYMGILIAMFFFMRVLAALVLSQRAQRFA